MCGRYVFFTPEEYEEYKEILKKIAESIKAGFSVYDPPADVFPGGEIYPGTLNPVIPSMQNAATDSKTTAKRGLVKMMRWGFPLHSGTSKQVINARGETLEERKMFKKCLPEKRCVIPAKGFYEWQKQGDKKIKTFIGPLGQDPLFMVGLYDEFRSDDEIILCYTIITVAANRQILPIHTRMPAILEERHLGLWLNDGLFAGYRSYLQQILKPYDKLLEIRPSAV